MLSQLDAATEALFTIKRIYVSNSSGTRRGELVDRVIRTLRLRGQADRAPLLVGLAEAIEDALIHAGD